MLLTAIESLFLKMFLFLDRNPLLFTFPLVGSTVSFVTLHHHHCFSRFVSDLFTHAPRGDTELQSHSTVSSHRPRIAIIGGGIAGVTAAASIASRFRATTNTSNPLLFEKQASRLNVDITIYEADVNCDNTNWKAATALNACSMVPSVSMHLLSQRQTLYQVMKDSFLNFFGTPSSSYNNNLISIPPTLMFSLQGCLGLSCTWSQRYSFLSFLYHFLQTSLTSSSQTLKERGQVLYQLSKAHQAAFTHDLKLDPTLAKKIGFQSGFISLYRSEEEARHVLDEAQEFGFDAQIVSMDQLKDMEPPLASLPLSMYAVFRPQDSSAHCALFIQDWIQKLGSWGVNYHIGTVVQLVNTCSNVSFGKARFQIVLQNGSIQDYDYVVLAAGAATPLFTQPLGVTCPTYPLRGWSLTVHCKSNTRVLNHAFSLDRIYGSSTSAQMVRLAGFGEMVGYRNVANNIKSHASEILVRYAQALLQGEMDTDDVCVLPCFRPLSPDDLPIVGKVKKVPGLFLHTGHGTLGWTLSLATADCVGQSVEDEINRDMDPCYAKGSLSYFTLADGSTIHTSVLSPDRFG